MFRDTLKPESKYVLLFVSPSSGLALQQRRDTAGPASPVSGASGAAPCWLRLTRQGNNFTAYDSRDGTTWVKLGETTVVMGTRARVGLAVCSHNDNALCRAQFDHVTVNGRIAAATAK
jgi:hypothetical protein